MNPKAKPTVSCRTEMRHPEASGQAFEASLRWLSLAGPVAMAVTALSQMAFPVAFQQGQFPRSSGLVAERVLQTCFVA